MQTMDMGAPIKEAENPEKYDSLVMEAGAAVVKAAFLGDAFNNDPSGLSDIVARSIVIVDDKRFEEVAALLGSHDPVKIHLEKLPETSDLAYLKLQQERLLKLSSRTLSLSVGRSMLTLCSRNSFFIFEIDFPKINLHGKTSHNDAVINLALDSPDLGVSSEMKKTFLNWPEFHNGVATSLMYTSSGIVSRGVLSDAESDAASKSWLRMNNQPEYTAAGFLFGRGLLGKLESLSMVDAYLILTPESSPKRLALILGLSVSRLATKLNQGMTKTFSSRDEEVSKLICLHVPAAFPVAIKDMKVLNPETQNVALLSLGILYYASGHSVMAKFLLAQVSNPRIKSPIEDMECHRLFAGLSLGLVLQGSGDDTTKAFFLKQLCAVLTNQQILFKQRNETKQKFSTVKESHGFNKTIITPGILMAAAIAYAGTDNSVAFKLVSVPSSSFEVNRTRPNFLMLRAISQNIIRKSFEHVFSVDSILQSLPECLRVGNENCTREGSLDRRLNIIAGTCFGLSLSNAGSSREDLKATILRLADALFTMFKLKKLLKAKYKKPRAGKQPSKILSRLKLLATETELLEDFPSTYTLTNCLVTMSCSLAIVMSGSCDLDSLRFIRKMRFNLFGFSYGHHMGLSMAIGLLFLGGGRYSLQKDPLSISLLLISFYPVWPQSTNDNRHHHQISRFLYALVAKELMVSAFEIDCDGCFVSRRVQANLDSSKSVTTPFISGNKQKISVTDEKYEQVGFDPETRTIAVRSKSRNHGLRSHINPLLDEAAQRQLISLRDAHDSQPHLKMFEELKQYISTE